MPNRVRFDGRSRRFYEVWYFIFNEPSSGDGYWIRYTLLNPLDAAPEAGGALWFAHTSRSDRSRHVAVVRPHAAGDVVARPGSPTIRIGTGTFEEGRLRGAIRSAGHEIDWELAYEPSPKPHEYFGPPIRTFAERRNSVTIPNPKIALSGTVHIDGHEHGIRSAIGHQAHHWGIEQAERWDWAHCCDFEEDPSAVVELLSAPTPLGSTATFVNLHSDSLTVRFDGLGALLGNRVASGLGFWRFEAARKDLRIVVDLRVAPEDVHRFEYVSTTYRRSECWNTQVADCLVRLYTRTGRGAESLTATLRSRGRAAAEIHDSDLDRIPYRAWLGGPGRS
jgi:hypothetical protein